MPKLCSFSESRYKFVPPKTASNGHGKFLLPRAVIPTLLTDTNEIFVNADICRNNSNRLYLNPLFTLKGDTANDITLTVFGLTCDARNLMQLGKDPRTNVVSLDITDIKGFVEAQSGTVLNGTFLIRALRTNGDFGLIPVTIARSRICIYHETSKNNYYRRATKNQVLVPFIVNCLSNDSENDFMEELHNHAQAVFNNIANIVRVTVLKFKKHIQNNNSNCRLGC